MKTKNDKNSAICHLIVACKWAYRKYTFNDKNLDWNEIMDMICKALNLIMGKEEFNSWIQQLKLFHNMEVYEETNKSVIQNR